VPIQAHPLHNADHVREAEDRDRIYPRVALYRVDGHSLDHSAASLMRSSTQLGSPSSGAITVGAGRSVCSFAAITASRAWAVMTSTVQRCQEVQQRTWCSSSPARPLAVWKNSDLRLEC
jgi:hypothetical protein